MIASVVAAFFDWGRRNAGTPSEIASTPVRAVAPDENARRSRKRVDRGRRLQLGTVAVAATGHPPRHRTNPTTA